jgi:hypothetical protein
MFAKGHMFPESVRLVEVLAKMKILKSGLKVPPLVSKVWLGRSRSTEAAQRPDWELGCGRVGGRPLLFVSLVSPS